MFILNQVRSGKRVLSETNDSYLQSIEVSDMSDKKKILVMDDDQDILTSIQVVLEAEGFDVTTALTGKAGLAAFNSDSFDFVLCDMMMEGVDSGANVAAEIRNKNKEIPVFLLSSITNATSANTEIDQLGFNGYFQKPITPFELVEAIKKALN
jgi:CheY-like chemotaxis protein